MTDTSMQTQPGVDNLDAELAELGDKYKGKSIVEIAKMHSEVEKEKSRIANELGTYRQMADHLMGLKQTEPAKPTVERKPVTADDLLTNTDDVLDKAVATNPVVSSAVERVDKLERDLKRDQFEKTFPDYNQDLADPVFADFIKSRPTYYQLATAANSGNYEAAAELWGLWNERKDLTQKATKAEAESDAAKRTKAERDGTLEGSSGAVADIARTYSREEWIMLQRRALAGDPVAKAKWNDPVFQKLRENAYRNKLVK